MNIQRNLVLVFAGVAIGCLAYQLKKTEQESRIAHRQLNWTVEQLAQGKSELASNYWAFRNGIGADIIQLRAEVKARGVWSGKLDTAIEQIDEPWNFSKKWLKEFAEELAIESNNFDKKP